MLCSVDTHPYANLAQRFVGRVVWLDQMGAIEDQDLASDIPSIVRLMVSSGVDRSVWHSWYVRFCWHLRRGRLNAAERDLARGVLEWILVLGLGLNDRVPEAESFGVSMGEPVGPYPPDREIGRRLERYLSKVGV